MDPPEPIFWLNVSYEYDSREAASKGPPEIAVGPEIMYGGVMHRATLGVPTTTEIKNYATGMVAVQKRWPVLEIEPSDG